LLNDDGREEWLLKDNKSMNGILVNGDPIGEEGCKLKVGDAITFGRRMIPPEFEFVFETTKAQIMSQSPFAKEEKVLNVAQEEKVLNAQEKKISELQNELEEERARTRAMTQRRKSRLGAMDDFQGELFCSICNDWLVNSSTITCSHTFCWACIDAWLVQKKFECPVCRQVVSREPIRSKALDTIVRKTVDRLTTTEKEDYISRVTVASLAQEKAENLHAELRLGVDEALEKGKAFFHIDGCWGSREKEVFQKGVGDYTGDARETYCKLTGLTVQWVQCASELKLNQALNNLQLQSHVDETGLGIRERLLMFLRYG